MSSTRQRSSEAGFEVSLFSLENFQEGKFEVLSNITPGARVLYRGWMLSAAEYRELDQALDGQETPLLVSAEEYLTSHYLPNWYPQISDYTPETRVFPVDADLAKELVNLGWDGFFIKDYVKSLKTSVGSRISTPEQATTLVAEMQKFRGRIEGGFCVRRIEEFSPNTEQRFFVIDGVAHAANGDVPDIVNKCAKRLKQRFYSIDIAQRSDGVLRVVEVGDGQVSDLVGWEVAAFGAIMKEHFGK